MSLPSSERRRRRRSNSHSNLLLTLPTETWVTDLESTPNSRVSPYDAAFPGTLPVSSLLIRNPYSQMFTAATPSVSTLHALTSPSELPLRSNQRFNKDQRLTGNITFTQIFPRDIKSRNATVGTNHEPIQHSFFNSSSLGPIARGGHVFLSQGNVAVRIEQIQLEQVTFCFSIHAKPFDVITRILENQFSNPIAGTRQLT